LDTVLRHVTVPLENTPRAFINHPQLPYFYIIQSDNNTLSAQNRKRLVEQQQNGEGADEELPPRDFGYPKARNHWASCLQSVNPIGYDSATGPILVDEEDGRRLEPEGIVETVHFDSNECPTALTAVTFESYPDEVFVIVGTALDLVVAPRSHSGGYIRAYRLINNGRTFEFVHRTKVEAPPTALAPFQGKVLAGMERNVFMYGLGIKQMLRKAQALKAVPNLITSISTMGSRIVCGDVQESVTYLVFKPVENKIIPFADDSVARWTTATTMVDYDTVAGGDKFGNLWLVRAPKKASDEADEEGAAGHLLNEKGYLGGTPNRLELLIHNYTNDIPTSLQKTSLISGQKEMLLSSGLQGSITALIPFDSREDANFFVQLEAEMRKEEPPLAGRDHLVYRGMYVPVKGVVDGDLCERFFLLGGEARERVAGELERSVREVVRKVSDLRTKFAF
jgi:splicing factor 3B subunit 3